MSGLRRILARNRHSMSLSGLPGARVTPLIPERRKMAARNFRYPQGFMNLKQPGFRI